MQDLPFQKKKKRVIRLRVLLWSGVGLLFGAALVGSAYFVLYHDFFEVSEFEMGDSRLVSENQVRASLVAQMVGENRLRSLLGPDNILFWVLGEKPEILKALPILGKVDIASDIVEKKVVITARERELFGIWCASQSECYAFDEKGIIFARAPRVEGALILKIEDTNNRSVVLGNPVFTREGWLENVFETLESIKRYDFAISSVTIRDSELEEWEVTVSSGPTFLFGLSFIPDNLENILKNLDKRFEFSKVTYFDFRVPNRIYYK